MAGLTTVGMIRALDTLTGKTAFGLPAIWVALTTTTPTAAAAGTEITTGQYGGYARTTLLNTSWSGGVAGVSTYNAVLDFGAASSSSGTNVLGVEFWDASTSGNRLWWEGLTSIAIVAGRHISFDSGQFVATIPVQAGGVGFSTTYANKMVDYMTGKTGFGTAPALWLCLLSSAISSSANGTELVYTGYARVQATTSLINGAAVVGANVDVVTNAQLAFGADTAGTQTAATNWSAMDAQTVGTGNLIGGSTLTNGTVAANLTPDFPSGSTLLRLS